VPLARLLAMAYRHLVVGCTSGWRPGVADVRPQYGYVLLACRDRPTTSGELAGCSGQQAGRVEARRRHGRGGAAARRTSAADSRAKPLSLTARGRRLLVQVEEIYLELEQEWADVLGRGRVEQVRRRAGRGAHLRVRR
jgi:hypothetical protein